MQKPEFNHCIEMLRSTDSIVYEDGYQWLQGYLDSNIDELVQLTLDEENPAMRSKFVELLGDSGNPEVIPFIEAELKSPHQEVRSWAYSSLRNFGDLNAKKIVIKFRNENPDEDFL